jgi:hypothetical protein
MISKLYTYIVTIGALTTLLAGCGGGGGAPSTSGPTNALHESTACIGCHDSASWVTPGDSKPLVAEWKNSSHMIANGAGCADCHDGGFMHPASCSKCHNAGTQATNPTANPDREGRCKKCHAVPNPRPGQNNGFNIVVTANGVPSGSTTGFVHFSTGQRASYVSSYNRLHCRNCHNPHNTAFGREQRIAWSESGHGITRGLARIVVDFKTRGTNLPLDKNFGSYSYCVRCHTTTGFLNFVAGDKFTDVNALRDIGADGLPDPNGLQTNAPAYTFPRSGANNGKIVAPNGQVVAYKDTSRELTGCNACHLDIRTDSASNPSSYSGTLRPVALATGVKIYYPYSTPGYKTVTPVQFDTLSNSNLCLACHSGRATGKTISEPGISAVVVAKKNPSAPSVHDFAGGAVLEGEKTAFLFYTDPAKYKTSPTHRSINIDGNGPCISCHMPLKQSTVTDGGLIHSHLFRPVTWTNDDINQDITEPFISNPTVCSRCHNGIIQPSLNPVRMNQLRIGFRVSLQILGRLLPQPFNNPGTGDGGWTGKNIYTTALFPALLPYGTAPVPSLGGLPAGSYTMGASYNYGFLFNEPSSYNHSPILARQLIYDSIDWLIHGAAGFGTSPGDVYTAIKNAPFTTNAAVPSGQQVAKPPKTIPNLFWTKVDVNPTEITGVSSTRNYQTYISPTAPGVDSDRDAAFAWLCKDYVPGSNVCNRW